MADTPTELGQPFEEARDAAIEAVWRWEAFERATTPTVQAAALVELANAMSDLSSWVPRCCEAGYFGQDHDCMKGESHG